MADENVQSLGVNLEIDNAEKFQTDLTDAGAAMDLFGESAQKLVDKATVLDTAFKTIGAGYTGLREAIASGIDLKSVTTQIDAALAAVNKAKAQATSETVRAVPGKSSGFENSGPITVGIGDAAEKAASIIKEANRTIQESTQETAKVVKQATEESALSYGREGEAIRRENEKLNQEHKAMLASYTTLKPANEEGEKPAIVQDRTVGASSAVRELAETTKAAAEQTKQATDQIGQVFSDMSAKVDAQTQAVSTALVQMGNDVQSVSAQVGANFKTAFEVMTAFQERTLSRLQIGRRTALANAVIPAEEKATQTQGIDTRAIQEMGEFSRIVGETNAAVAALKAQQQGLDASSQEFKSVQKEINAAEKEGVNNLRLLSVESGNYSDHLKEQLRVASQLNKENVGAKSVLSPTREGFTDAGSESLIKSIRDRMQKSLSTISDIVEKSGGLGPILEKQVSVEKAASEAETSIYAALDDTVGKSVDYRKMKLHEILDEVTQTTAALIAEGKREMSENQAKLAFDKAYADTEAKLAQTQASRQRTLDAARLGFTDTKQIGGKISGSATEEMAQLEAVKQRALSAGPGDHGLLEELKNIQNQAKETTAELRREVQASAEQDLSLAAAARKRSRNQVSGMTAGEVVTGRIQIATESDNVLIRTIARSIQEVQDAFALASVYGEAFRNVIGAIVGIVQGIISPFVALFNALKAVGEGFASLTRFASFGFLGGKKAGIDEETASVKRFDTELKTVSESAKSSESSLSGFLSIFSKGGLGQFAASIKDAVSSFLSFGTAAKTADTDMTAAAAHSSQLATGLQHVGVAAKESEGKVKSFIDQFRSGIIEGIGKGIAETLTMSVTMSLQNMVFGIGDSIKGAFEEAFTIVDDMMALTGMLQRDIMHTKGYDNLAQAEGEASAQAKELYAWMEKLSIVSPFKKDEIIGLFQTAQGFGFTAKNAQVLTQSLADFATVSHTGIAGANGIVQALGQIRETGVVTSRIIKSLGKEGIDVMPILQKTFGMSAAGINKALKEQQLDAKKTIEAIITAINKDYGGQAAKGGGTVPGLLSSIADLKNKLMATSIEPIMEGMAKPVLMFIATVMQTKEVGDFFERLGQAIKDFGMNAVRIGAQGFYLIKAALDAIPQPIKTFYNEWGKMHTMLTVGSLVLIAIPPILGLLGAALAALVTPISLTAAALAALSLSYQNDLFGIKEITDTVIAGVIAAWNYMVTDGFVVVIDYLGTFYNDFVSFLSEIPTFLSDVVGEALDILYEVPQGFADVMNAVIDYGSAIVQFFAKGIVEAAGYVVKALNYIGSIISEWLAPHSPPKIVPDLEKWGKQAADIYFKGWTKADMSMFKDLSGMLEKAVGAIRPDGLSAQGTKRIRETIASAIQGYKQTGTLDESGLRDVGGRFNNEIISLAHAYITAAESANKLQKAQDELDTTTKDYDAKLSPLQSHLKAIQDTMSNFDISAQIKDLQNVMSNKFATTDQREQAKAKLDELATQKQINTLDAEKNSKTSAIQDRINKATEENKTAQDTLDLLKERFEQEIAMIALENKKSGGDSSDSEKKGRTKKPKKEKLTPVVDTAQPDLGSLDLPELDTSSMGSLADILAKAKSNVKSALGNVKDAIQPAIEAFGKFKEAASAAADAVADGFGGGSGKVYTGLQNIAFNVGFYLGLANLAIQGFLASVSTFATTFANAFTLTPGSIGEKITAGLDATGVNDKITAFKTLVLGYVTTPISFATAFAEAFTTTSGTITEKISAGLSASGIGPALTKFKADVLEKVQALFGGSDVGERGRDAGGGGGIVANIAIAIKGFFSAITWDNLESLATSLKDSIKTKLDEIGWDKVVFEFGKLTSAVSDTLTKIDWLKASEAAGHSLSNIGSALSGVIGDLLTGTAFSETLKLWLSLFGSVVAAVVGSILSALGWKETLKGVFDPLATSVKDTISTIDWKTALKDVFTNFGGVVFGLLKDSLTIKQNLSEGNPDTSMPNTDKAIGKASFSAASLAADILETIHKNLDITMILAAAGLAIGTMIREAFTTAASLTDAIAKAGTNDKQEKSIGRIIGDMIGESIVGVIAGAFMLVTSANILSLIKSTLTIVADIGIIIGEILIGIIEGAFGQLDAFMRTQEAAMMKADIAIRDALLGMVNGLIDALNSPISKLNELLNVSIPKFDKIDVPIDLAQFDFKFVNPKDIKLDDAIKITGEQVALQASTLVKLDTQDKVLLDINAIAKLDEKTRMLIPPDKIIQVDGKQQLVLNPSDIVKVPGGQQITVAPGVAFKIDDLNPISTTVPINASFKAMSDELDKKLGATPVNVKPTIGEDGKLHVSDLVAGATGGTDKSALNIALAATLPEDQKITAEKITPDGTGKIFLPIVLSMGSGTGEAGAAGATAGLDTSKIGEDSAKGILGGAQKVMADKDIGFGGILYKYMITDPLAMLGIQSPSTVADEKLGYPVGQGIVQGTNRALKEAGDLMAGTKTSFATSYTSIKTVTDGFSTSLKAKYTVLKNDSTKIFTDMSTAVKKLFTDLKDEIVRLTQEMHDDVISLLDDIRAKAEEDFAGIKDAGIDEFKKLKTDVVALVADMDKAILDELSTLSDRISKTLKDTLDSLNASGGVKDKFKTFGTDVGLAFINGIIAGLTDSSALARLSKAAQAVGEKVKQGADQGTGGGDTGGDTGGGNNSGGGQTPFSRSGAFSSSALASFEKALSSLTTLGKQAGSSVNTSSFALPSTDLKTAQTTNRTYVLNMNVSQSQIPQVALNYALFESMTG